MGSLGIFILCSYRLEMSKSVLSAIPRMCMSAEVLLTSFSQCLLATIAYNNAQCMDMDVAENPKEFQE